MRLLLCSDGVDVKAVCARRLAERSTRTLLSFPGYKIELQNEITKCIARPRVAARACGLYAVATIDSTRSARL